MGRDNGCVLVILSSVEANAKKLKSVADTCPDLWCILADASGEDQSVQSAQDSGKGPDTFLDLVAKQCQRVGSPRILSDAASSFAGNMPSGPLA